MLFPVTIKVKAQIDQFVKGLETLYIHLYTVKFPAIMKTRKAEGRLVRSSESNINRYFMIEQKLHYAM